MILPVLPLSLALATSVLQDGEIMPDSVFAASGSACPGSGIRHHGFVVWICQGLGVPRNTREPGIARLMSVPVFYSYSSRIAHLHLRTPINLLPFPAKQNTDPDISVIGKAFPGEPFLKNLLFHCCRLGSHRGEGFWLDESQRGNHDNSRGNPDCAPRSALGKGARPYETCQFPALLEQRRLSLGPILPIHLARTRRRGGPPVTQEQTGRHPRACLSHPREPGSQHAALGHDGGELRQSLPSFGRPCRRHVPSDDCT